MNQAGSKRKGDAKSAKKMAKEQRRQQRRENVARLQQQHTAQFQQRQSALGTPSPAVLSGFSQHYATSAKMMPKTVINKKTIVEPSSCHGDVSMSMANSAATYPKRTFQEFTIPKHVLDDICARFPLTVGGDTPSDEEALHLLFVIEECYWFYLDFSCRDDASLEVIEFETFARQVFERYTKLARFVPTFAALYRAWEHYKRKIPVHGAILIDETLEWLVLVRQVRSNSWFFPKGKINEDESPRDCAIREVLEECGFDCSALIDGTEFLFLPSNLTNGVAAACDREPDGNLFRSRLFLVSGVPRDTPLVTRTRNEIGQIEWFRIDELRRAEQANEKFSEFFRVYRFLSQIEHFIVRKRQQHFNEAKRTVMIDSKPQAAWNELRIVTGDSDGNAATQHVSLDASVGFQFEGNVTLNKYEQMDLRNYILLYNETMEQQNSRPTTLPSPDSVLRAMLREKAMNCAGASAVSSTINANFTLNSRSDLLRKSKLQTAGNFDFLAPSWCSPALDTKCILNAFKTTV